MEEQTAFEELNQELSCMKGIINEQSRAMTHIESLVIALDHKFEVVMTSVNQMREELSMLKRQSNGLGLSSPTNDRTLRDTEGSVGNMLQPMIPQTIKSEFPRFTGKKPMSWVYWAEQCFTISQVPEESKVELASFHFKHEARRWYHGFEKTNDTPSWPEFVKAVCVKFGRSPFQDFIGTKLCQTSSVRDYQNQFKMLAIQKFGLSESFFISCFISGLKEEIRCHVQMFQPTTLLDAFGLAQAQENKILAEHRQLLQPSTKASRANGSMVIGQTSQSFESLKSTAIEERRGKEPFCNCNQKYNQGHHFGIQQIFSSDEALKFETLRLVDNQEMHGVEANPSSLNGDIIISHILPRLPAKSLCRFRCVCKRWNDLILEDPSFARNQSQKHTKVSGFFYTSHKFRCCFGSIGKSAGVPDQSMSFLTTRVSIMASTNGLIVCRGENNSPLFYVCNPVTKEYRMLTSNRERWFSPFVGLAFNPSISPTTFKLVRSFVHEDYERIGFDIFSSETGEWIPSSVTHPRRIGFNDHPAPGIFIGGIIYWLFAGDFVIFSFEVDNDCCQLIQLPSLTAEADQNSDYIAEFEGYLSYVEVRERDMRVWILKESSTAGWTRRYRVSLEGIMKYPELFVLPGRMQVSAESNIPLHVKYRLVLPGIKQVSAESNLPLQPLAFQSGEVALLWWMHKKLFAYHFQTRKLTEIQFSGLAKGDLIAYTNSLVPLPRVALQRH